jgi:uncharacterized membrane protein YphA (DoxX/SURF4 family)
MESLDERIVEMNHAPRNLFEFCRVMFLAAIRLTLGVLFLYSGFIKLRFSFDFLAAVYDYRIFGPHLAAVVSAGIPWLEIFIGLCLLGDLLVPGALLVVCILGLALLAVIGSALYRRLHIKCGCFASNDIISAETLARSTLVLIIAATGFVLSLRRSDSSVRAIAPALR